MSGAAPLQTIGEPPPSHVYRPGASRAAVAIRAACLFVVSEVAEAVIAFPASDQFIEADHTGRTSFSPDYTLGYSLVALLTFGMLVVAYVTTGLWLWQPLDAEVLAPDSAPAPPRLGVGHVVVPIVFLWFPFNVVRDIATATRDTERSRPSARFVGFWWGTWLVYVVAVQISSRLVPWNGAPGATAARALVWVEVLSAVASAVALLFWIKIVRGIHTSQEHRATQLSPDPGRRAATRCPPCRSRRSLGHDCRADLLRRSVRRPRRHRRHGLLPSQQGGLRRAGLRQHREGFRAG